MHRTGSSLALAVLVCCALAKEMTDIEALMSQPRRCTYEHAYDMYGAHCAGLRLDKIPNLKGGIEILDFSDNKLQELKADTFAGYTSIKFLYLAENQIYDISVDAFSSLTELQTLDLSRNVIINIPHSILQLPYLQKLYLNGNPLIHMSLNNLASNKDIKAPLQLLDMSDCKIKVLPEWGPLPQLLFYNISNNPLNSLEAKHFAVMCNLVKVDISKSIDDMKLCSLKSTISWFQDKHIYFHLEDYSKLNSKEFDKCPSIEASQTLNTTYHKCKNMYFDSDNNQPSRRTWLPIVGGLVGFLVMFMLLLYVMHRHNVAQIKNTEKKTEPMGDVGDKQATAILLNDVA